MIKRMLLFLSSFFCAFFSGVIYSDIHNIKIRRYVIRDKKLKGDLRIVCLSDLHGREFGKENAGLVKKIAAQKPDMILMAGDIMTAKDLAGHIRGSVDVACTLIEKLKAVAPVYYGMGNHESRVEWKPWLFEFSYADMMERIRSTGVKLLDNDSTDAEYGIRIYGINLPQELYLHTKPKFLSTDMIDGMVGKRDESSFSILLAHDPEYIPAYAAWGADLSVSGHYHGGIMRLPYIGGVISPKPRIFPDFSGGMYRLRGTHQLVLCGLGTHTLPVRVFNPAELVVLELKKERD